MSGASFKCPNRISFDVIWKDSNRKSGKGWDHSGLVRALEKLANFEIGQQPA